MVFVVLLLVGCVTWNNKPLPLTKNILKLSLKIYQSNNFLEFSSVFREIPEATCNGIKCRKNRQYTARKFNILCMIQIGSLRLAAHAWYDITAYVFDGRISPAFSMRNFFISLWTLSSLTQLLSFRRLNGCDAVHILWKCFLLLVGWKCWEVTNRASWKCHEVIVLYSKFPLVLIPKRKID